MILNGTAAPDGNGITDSGAVYTYQKVGTTWQMASYVKPQNPTAGDQFGHQVALSGNTLAVSSPYEDENYSLISNASANGNTLSNSGAVYIFENDGGWISETYIKAQNSGADDQFGTSLALSGDTLVVGASLEDSNETTIINGGYSSVDNSGSNVGAVYVFQNSDRLFDPPEFRVSASTTSSLDLSWGLNTGSGIGVRIVYVTGSTAPADCASGTLGYDGPLATATINGLTPATEYSFRICSHDGSTYSPGSVLTTATD